jgi:hypothetical protein
LEGSGRLALLGLLSIVLLANKLSAGFPFAADQGRIHRPTLYKDVLPILEKPLPKLPSAGRSRTHAAGDLAWYDNSRSNPHDPDPEAIVTWGDQTSQEMMVGFFDVAVPANVDKEQFFIRGQGAH